MGDPKNGRWFALILLFSFVFSFFFFFIECRVSWSENHKTCIRFRVYSTYESPSALFYILLLSPVVIDFRDDFRWLCPSVPFSKPNRLSYSLPCACADRIPLCHEAQKMDLKSILNLLSQYVSDWRSFCLSLPHAYLFFHTAHFMITSYKSKWIALCLVRVRLTRAIIK